MLAFALVAVAFALAAGRVGLTPQGLPPVRPAAPAGPDSRGPAGPRAEIAPGGPVEAGARLIAGEGACWRLEDRSVCDDEDDDDDSDDAAGLAPSTALTAVLPDRPGFRPFPSAPSRPRPRFLLCGRLTC